MGFDVKKAVEGKTKEDLQQLIEMSLKYIKVWLLMLLYLWSC